MKVGKSVKIIPYLSDGKLVVPLDSELVDIFRGIPIFYAMINSEGKLHIWSLETIVEASLK